MTSPTGRPGLLLAVDTATTHAVIALGDPDGSVVAERTWIAGYRHGEELLPRIEALLRERNVRPPTLGGLVVGTGPGAFTGLRVGLATVKGLAYALGLPVVGVATGAALLAAAPASAGSADANSAAPASAGSAAEVVAGAAASGLVLMQPAGPSDTVLSRPGQPPRIVPGGTDPGLSPDERLVAVDLEGRVPAAASTLGATALTGLAAALLRSGAARLARGDSDDLALLVPEYVTLPRGVRALVPETAVEVTGAGGGT